MDQEKLLDWCNETFNFETQKWECDNIPEDVLDCIIDIMEKWWPHYDNEHQNDFVNDFIYEKIVCWKQAKIAKIWLKEAFEEQTKDLFD